MTRKLNVGPDASVYVDYVNSTPFDHLCVFTVRFGKAGTHYAMTIDAAAWATFVNNDYNDEKLHKHLLENIKSATFIRSCADCRALTLVTP